MGWAIFFVFSSAFIAALHPEFHPASQHFLQQQQQHQQSNRLGASEDGPPTRYYFSAESADYKAARKTCQILYGKNYGLAVIQSKQDLKDMNAYLGQFMSSGSELWVGGLFLKGRGKWVWDTLIDPTTQESTDFSPYAESLFSDGVPHPTKESMAYYTMIDKYSGQLDSAEPTTTRRFLCEYQDNNWPIPCREKTDIAVVLDSSASISTRDYDLAKNGSAAIVRTFAQHDPSRQYGNIFSDKVQTVLPLTFTGSVEAKMQKFLTAPHLNGNTNTGGAIEDAANVLKQNKRSDAPQAMVVITDGMSNVGPNVGVAAASARAGGVIMVAVGVGDGCKMEELEDIASSKDLVFKTETWSDLDKVLVKITAAMCPNSRLSRNIYF